MGQHNDSLLPLVKILVLFQLASYMTLPSFTSSAFVVQHATVARRNPCRYKQRFRTNPFRLSKWDNLVDEDDENDNDFYDGPPIPFDMKYTERNVKRQHLNFVAIRDAGGVELTNDIYVKDPSAPEFWFVGKVARVSDVSVQDCVARQYPLMEQHAVNLRPLELYPHRGSLEIWTAPGDSELDVAYNRPNVTFCKMEKHLGTKIKNNLVGFSGEVYQDGEEGFRTWRDVETGKASQPQVVGPQDAEKRAPTDEEMEEIRQQLKGQDLNDLFENETK